MFELRVPFGVELEFSQQLVQESELQSAIAAALREEGQRLGREELPDKWTFKHDGSCGYEFTTPILKTDEELLLLGRVVKAIQVAFRGRDLVASNCGLHIHMDVGDLTRNNIRDLFGAFIKLEPFMYKMVPNSRNGHSYCHSLAQNTRHYDDEDHEVPFATDHSTGVNLCDWYRRGSMEIRYGSGTCDQRKVVGWISMLQGIFRRTLESGKPTRAVDNINKFWRWMGHDHDAKWDQKISAWINRRYEHLENHDPSRNRRNYQEARRIRNDWEGTENHMLRQYHYWLRRDMTREERRAHDREVMEKHGREEIFAVPESYTDTYYEQFPGRRDQGNEDEAGPQGETEAATQEATPAETEANITALPADCEE